MRTVSRTVGVVAAVAVAMASSVIAFGWFSIRTCRSFDDTGGSGPTAGSLQGRICAQSYADSALSLLVLAIPVAGLLAVALLITVWPRGSTVARLCAVAGLVALPLAATVLLSLPPNS